LNPDGPAVVSPIKIIKVTDRYNPLPKPPTLTSSIDNLLSTKKLEPVQVHSVISKVGNPTKSSPTVVQTVNIKTLINTSPISTNKFDEINIQDLTIQCPRKKRDFYGKSSSSSSNNRFSRCINKTDSSLSNKNRPSSTPACTQVLLTTTLPDRPVSIPPLKTSH
jgi:hypothetical protein